MTFLKLIRYPNLGIIIFTQFLFYWFIHQVFEQNGIHPILDFPHFSLLVLTTLFIAASGYIINDLFYYKIDLINKPDKIIIGKHIPITTARFLYIATIAIGTIIALYLAVHIDNFRLFLIYPLAIFIMWFYSKNLKKKPLSGNIVIAFFAAFVPGIVWFAERKGFSALNSDNGIQMKNLFEFYMLFAFCSTLFREVIKDIEDFKGDRDNHCKTLPIVFGIQKTRYFAFGLGTILLGSILFWFYTQYTTMGIGLLTLTLILLLAPTLFMIGKLYLSASKKNYHQTSQIAKLVMVFGLLYFSLFLVIK